MRRFLSATAAGYRTATVSPDAAAEALLAAAPESDRSLVEASTPFLAPFLTDSTGGWGSQEPAVWERFDAFLREAKIISAAVPLTGAFTNDFLPTP